MSKLLSLRQVSEALGLHIDTVRRYVREGRIQAARFGRVYRGRWRVAIQVFMTFIVMNLKRMVKLLEIRENTINLALSSG